MNGQTPSRRQNIPSRQPGRRVVLLSLIVMVGLVAAIVVGVIVSLKGVQRRMNDAGLTSVRAFDEFMSGFESDLLTTSDALAATDDVEEVLRLTLARQSTIFELFLADSQGNILQQRRRVGRTEATVIDRPWLTAVQEGQVYISPVEYDEGGMPFVDMATVVTGGASASKTTLLARVDLSTLWGKATKLRIGKTGYVYITDEAGQLLAYRDMQLVQDRTTLKDAVGRTPQAITNGRTHLYTGLAGGLVIATGQAMAVVPWYVIAEQPIGDALPFFWWLAAVLLVLLMVVTGLLVYNRQRSLCSQAGGG